MSSFSEEFASTGFSFDTSRDLDFCANPSQFVTSASQLVALRFDSVFYSATETNTVLAYVRFTTRFPSAGSVSVSIRAETACHPENFLHNTLLDVYERRTTSTVVEWKPSEWWTVGEQGYAQCTADLRPLLAELWSSGAWGSDCSLSLVLESSADTMIAGSGVGSLSSVLTPTRIAYGWDNPPLLTFVVDSSR